MSDCNNHTNSQGSEVGKKTQLARLPADAVAIVERKIEKHFRQWVTELVSKERWSRSHENLNRPGPLRRHLKWRREQLLGIVREFAGDYATLLENAAVEYARELGTLFDRSSSRLNGTGLQEVLSALLLFPERFTEGIYDRPWDSFFMLPSADCREMPDQRTLMVDFQRGNSIARLFHEAEEATTPDTVANAFWTETAKWRTGATRRVWEELQLCTVGLRGDQLAKTKGAGDLTQRERRIWTVIQRGLKGMAYCREVHNAGLKPRKPWLDEGCPSTYPEAYREGQPWRKRIQDEKHRIHKKAKLANE